MSSPRFIKLSNGVIFDLNQVKVIFRKDINEHAVVIDGVALTPRADAGDVEFMESLLQPLSAPEKPAVAIPPLPPSRLAIVE